MRFLAVVFVVISIAACETPPKQQFENSTYSKFSPLIGKSEDEVISRIGAPARVDNIGSYKVYYYITDQGVVSQTDTNIWKAAWGRPAEVQTVRQYDQVRLYFKDGIASRWDTEYVRAEDD